jgi:hypothetical protein
MHTELGLALMYRNFYFAQFDWRADTVFHCHIEQLEMREYISNFNTRLPLLSITSHFTSSHVVNYENSIVRERIQQ